MSNMQGNWMLKETHEELSTKSIAYRMIYSDKS